MLNICGKPTIQYLIENLKKSHYSDDIILCTTLESSDDNLCSLAKSCGIKYFRGSTEDKIDRWLGACKKYGVEFFVTADGDDIFCDHGLIDSIFEQHERTKSDFIDGRGLYNDVYGISFVAIEEVCKNKNNRNTEFIKPYFDAYGNKYKIQKADNVPSIYHKKNIRMTLDYEEDLLFFKEVISHFKTIEEDMNFENILSFLEKNPHVTKINWFREESWKQNQNNMIQSIKDKGL
tara:strand:- start:563 stop:1264 length:702 start_codon:yes stop_codon:yes gene_type:complete